MKIISKNIVLYVLFTFLVLGFFVDLRFPGKVVQSYLLDTMAERYPQASFSLGDVALSFPPGLKMENFRFGFRDNPEPILRLEVLRVRPRLFGYLTGHASLAMSALAYGGALRGRVDYPRLIPANIPAGAELKIEDLNLEKMVYLQEKLGRRISGKLSGAFNYDGASRLDFQIRNGSYQLLEKILGIDRLDFSQAEGQIELKGGLLKLNKLRLQGDKINCSLNGSIVLNPDFKNSEINLTGTMELAAMGNKKISLAISGTIANARTRYL